MNKVTAALVLSVALLSARAVAASDISVRSSDELRAALQRARGGDAILLQPGATYTGTFVLGDRPGSGYITIRSATADSQLPATGSRMTPSFAGKLAIVKSGDSDPAFKTEAGAHHWRLLALEITSASGGGELVRLGDGTSAQNNRDRVPHDLVVERCYIHGPHDARQRRGVAVNSASTTIADSWISDIKADGQDSQAIEGWNGPGPFLISNNYLEAAGENVMFGGADPWIDRLVPANITIKGNWIRKPTEWRSSRWQVKNLLELKNARQVVIEDNLLENNWRAAQPGDAVLFTPRNQEGRAPWSTVEDVQFRHNVVRHVASAFNLLGHDNEHSSQQLRRVTIADNLVYDVNAAHWGGNGNFLTIGDGPADIAIEHNTVLQTGNILSAYGGSAASPTRISGFVFRNNVVLHNQYGMKGDSHGVGNATLSAYFPGAVVAGNVIAGGESGMYPRNNEFPSVDRLNKDFVDVRGENFQLARRNDYARSSTDGRQPGVDPAVARRALGHPRDVTPVRMQ